MGDPVGQQAAAGGAHIQEKAEDAAREAQQRRTGSVIGTVKQVTR